MKIQTKKVNKYKWHEKFAWWWTEVDDHSNKRVRVWLERYMRRHSSAGSNPHWIKLSKREYFKRKLANDNSLHPKESHNIVEEPDDSSGPMIHRVLKNPMKIARDD